MLFSTRDHIATAHSMPGAHIPTMPDAFGRRRRPVVDAARLRQIARDRAAIARFYRALRQQSPETAASLHRYALVNSAADAQLHRHRLDPCPDTRLTPPPVATW